MPVFLALPVSVLVNMKLSFTVLRYCTLEKSMWLRRFILHQLLNVGEFAYP